MTELPLVVFETLSKT
jgi:hypothetical protein